MTNSATVPLSQKIARRALAAKALARRNRSRRNYVYLASVAIGMTGLALGVWAHPEWAERSAGAFAIAVLLCTGGAVVVLWRFPERITPTPAECPQCGHSWEIQEGRSFAPHEYMPNWLRCPGCGLPMRDGLLERHAQQP